MTAPPCQYKVQPLYRMDTISDKLKEKYGAQLTLMFQPIDFSNILGFPNYSDGLGDAYNWIPTFHGDYGDLAIWHVRSFLQLIANFNIIYEDNMMEMFARTFQDEADY